MFEIGIDFLSALPFPSLRKVYFFKKAVLMYVLGSYSKILSEQRLVDLAVRTELCFATLYRKTADWDTAGERQDALLSS